MRVFVTGASGFLGRFLRAALEARGDEVVGPGSGECNLLHADSLETYGEIPFDRVFHLAAWTQAGDFCLYHPGEQWVINQRINTNVLDWWRRRQPQAKIVCMGTSCSYDPAMELSEENYLVGTPIESLFTYAMTKRMLYVGLMALWKQYGLRYLHLVPSTLYGPGYHLDGRQMHFIFDLVRKILRGKFLGEPVILWGDGHQRREIFYVEDFVRIALELVLRCENETVNIGAGREYSIREFARLICERVGYDPEALRYDTGRYVGARSKCLDTGKLHSVIPDVRLTSLDAGLGRTIDWFLANKAAFLS
ncbi:MAG: NAD-dependent epimerase/dehydratase family protein [Deltaproteobacteria bacterium]|nr:MAG: NAD-dependent epimerase/dehydratase family protein [Deltaproteobacteria bacterium]